MANPVDIVPTLRGLTCEDISSRTRFTLTFDSLRTAASVVTAIEENTLPLNDYDSTLVGVTVREVRTVRYSRQRSRS